MLLLFPRIAPLFSIITVNYSHQKLRKVHTKTCTVANQQVVLSIRVFSVVLAHTNSMILSLCRTRIIHFKRWGRAQGARVRAFSHEQITTYWASVRTYDLCDLMTVEKLEALLAWNNSLIPASTYYSQIYSRIIGTGLYWTTWGGWKAMIDLP